MFVTVAFRPLNSTIAEVIGSLIPDHLIIISSPTNPLFGEISKIFISELSLTENSGSDEQVKINNDKTIRIHVLFNKLKYISSFLGNVFNRTQNKFFLKKNKLLLL